MAFSDPQSVTINAIANPLPRVGMDSTAGTFKKDDQTVGLKISQASGRRRRQAIRLDHQKVAPDVLNPALSSNVSASVTLVVDTPLRGYSLTEIKQIVDGLTAYLTASSGARVTQLLGGEI